VAGASLPASAIAVLPLANLSGDPAQDYLADGMTDELITWFVKFTSLRVISRTSAMQYKGVRKTIPQIAGELGVDAILEGSVTRSDRQVRITARLIDGKTGRYLWAEDYSGRAGDVLARR
jgi:TolB-like protein